MFKLDFQMEGTHIVAIETVSKPTEPGGIPFCKVLFIDDSHGQTVELRMKMLDVLRLLTVAMTSSGEETVTTTYAEADAMLGDNFPTSDCRPIP
jgi:hypothetical protein